MKPIHILEEEVTELADGLDMTPGRERTGPSSSGLSNRVGVGGVN